MSGERVPAERSHDTGDLRTGFRRSIDQPSFYALAAGNAMHCVRHMNRGA
jgi:hypothetical protein